MSIYQGLNPQQHEAVHVINGPLLILAGAGTGKTRVLTTRIAHLINQGYCGIMNICAVTFTNKAAREMKLRIGKYCNDENLAQNIKHLWAGTFHSLGARILRRHAQIIGFTSDFTIIDADDSLRLIKSIMKNMDISDEMIKPASVVFAMNQSKDLGVLWQEFPSADAHSALIKKIYGEYQTQLRAANSMDFGDILVYNLQIMKQPEIAQYWRDKFRFILVDEFQDTNIAQYLWLKSLVNHEQNICAVGDDDQSIYGWRGAQIANILNFPKDFANTKIIKLEQNYRSSANILASATNIIKNNQGRHDKTLFTENLHGESVKVLCFDDMNQEARTIATHTNKLLVNGYQPRDFAILVRASYQMRALESELNYHAIPYKVVGGAKFFNREEVRDAVAYLRLCKSPQDNLSFLRIANKPTRGLGDKMMEKIQQYSQENNCGYFIALQAMLDKKIVKSAKLAEFCQILTDISAKIAHLKPSVICDDLLESLGYYEYLQKNPDKNQARSKRENLHELVIYLDKYSEITEFLEEIALMSDNDEDINDNMLVLSTIHSAKGLEFKCVFLPGWEQGVFPSSRSLDEHDGIEEERRLAYVAITRARELLFISFALNRMIYGGFDRQTPSIFLENIKIPSQEWQFPSPQTRQMVLGYTASSYPQNSFQPNNKKPAHKPCRFNLGDNVRHPRFGTGVIVKITDDTALVNFESGEKNILIDFLD